MIVDYGHQGPPACQRLAFSHSISYNLGSKKPPDNEMGGLHRPVQTPQVLHYWIHPKTNSQCSPDEIQSRKTSLSPPPGLMDRENILHPWFCVVTIMNYYSHDYHSGDWLTKVRNCVKMTSPHGRYKQWPTPSFHSNESGLRMRAFRRNNITLKILNGYKTTHSAFILQWKCKVRACLTCQVGIGCHGWNTIVIVSACEQLLEFFYYFR